MGKCDLSLEMEKFQYFPGDTVEVTLKMVGNANFTCKDITIELVRRAHGRGNTHNKSLEKVSVFKGEVKEGDELEWAANFVLPDKPFSYHGKYLNVDWILKANVDVAWAFDPKCEIDFELVPNPQTPLPKPVENIQKFGNKQSKSIFLGAGCIFVFTLIPLSIFLTSLGAVLSGEGNAIVGVLFSGVMLFAMLLVIFFILRNRIALKAVGPVQFHFDQDYYLPNQTITGMLVFTPRKKFLLNKITAEIKCSEIVVRGSGTNKSTYTNVLVSEQLFAESEMQAYKNDAIEIPFEYKLPDEPYYSFQAPSNNLKWAVETHIDIDKWPDFVHSWKINVCG